MHAGVKVRCGGTGASPQELKLGSRGVSVAPGGSLGRSPRWYTLQLTPEQALQEASGSLQLQVSLSPVTSAMIDEDAVPQGAMGERQTMQMMVSDMLRFRHVPTLCCRSGRAGTSRVMREGSDDHPESCMFTEALLSPCPPWGAGKSGHALALTLS